MDVEREHYSLLTATCVAMFFGPLMGAAVNAVLPEIGHGLSAGATQLSLVTGVYTLGMAVFQLSCGSLGDIWGHRKIFLAGSIVFGLSGAILSCLNSITAFLFFRFVQGAAAAMIGASGMALIASCSKPEKRPAYLGFNTAAVYAGLACAPPIAGFVAGTLGWRWLFLGSALASAMVFCLMRFTSKHEWRPAAEQHFDLAGCFFYALAMSGLTIGSALLGKNPVWGWTCMVGFIFFLLVFCRRQIHSSFPILNLRLLRQNRLLTLSCLAAFINYASFFGVLFYFAIYAQVGRGLSVELTGLLLSIQPLVQVICTPLATRLCKIWEQGWVSALGAGLCGIGLLVAAFLRLDSSWSIFVVTQCMLGAGITFFGLANTALILESGGKQNVGQTSALTGAVRTTGNLSSMVLITLTMGIFLGNAPVILENMPAIMSSMRMNLVLFSLFNLSAILCVFVRNRQ